jgi:hypothetical protein
MFTEFLQLAVSRVSVLLSIHPKFSSSFMKPNASPGHYTECFKKSFTTFKVYTNLYKGHTQRFEQP